MRHDSTAPAFQPHQGTGPAIRREDATTGPPCWPRPATFTTAGRLAMCRDCRNCRSIKNCVYREPATVATDQTAPTMTGEGGQKVQTLTAKDRALLDACITGSFGRGVPTQGGTKSLEAHAKDRAPVRKTPTVDFAWGGVKQWGLWGKDHPETGYPCESGGIIGGIFQKRKTQTIAPQSSWRTV